MLKKIFFKVWNYYKNIKLIILRREYVAESELLSGHLAVVAGEECLLRSAVAEKLAMLGTKVIFRDSAEIADMNWFNTEEKPDIWINLPDMKECQKYDGDFLSFSLKEWDEFGDTECKSLYFKTQRIGKYFIEQGIRGHIVQVLYSENKGNFWCPEVFFQKAAVDAVKGMAERLARKGITVNCVVLEDDRVSPQMVSDAVEFLASDMGEHMVGSCLVLRSNRK